MSIEFCELFQHSPYDLCVNLFIILEIQVLECFDYFIIVWLSRVIEYFFEVQEYTQNFLDSL